MFNEFYGELQWRQWHRVLTKILEKQIYIALVKEFYSNIYDPEDGAPKYYKVQGHVIRFDTETINDFLDNPVILAGGEEYLSYSQYLHTYPDHEAIVVALCTSEGGFVLNVNGTPWKLLRKDLTSLTQAWTVLYYFNLAPTSHTFDLNVDRATLIYGLVMKMDMDLGSFILGQITQIAQSNTSRLGLPVLIKPFCDAQGVVSDTPTFESLSPVINLAYIKKNC
ncbi:hypothetical protein HKD37_18G051231 [Glycine soja]